MTAASGDVFEIIVICTGNRFRSPLVAAYLREATRGLPVSVSSAGTLDLGGLPVLEGAASAAREQMLDLARHRSRYIADVPLNDADLVLGFERIHVTAAVVDQGAPRERVFTLPELVSLLEQSEPPRLRDPIERARAAVARANLTRGRQSGLRMPEVADPIGTSPRVQHKTALQLIDLSGRLAPELFGLQVTGVVRSPWRERRRGRG